LGLLLLAMASAKGQDTGPISIEEPAACLMRQTLSHNPNYDGARVVGAGKIASGYCFLLELRPPRMGCDPVKDPAVDCKGDAQVLRTTLRALRDESGEFRIQGACPDAVVAWPEGTELALDCPRAEPAASPAVPLPTAKTRPKRPKTKVSPSLSKSVACKSGDVLVNLHAGPARNVCQPIPAACNDTRSCGCLKPFLCPRGDCVDFKSGIRCYLSK